MRTVSTRRTWNASLEHEMLDLAIYSRTPTHSRSPSSTNVILVFEFMLLAWSIESLNVKENRKPANTLGELASSLNFVALTFLCLKLQT